MFTVAYQGEPGAYSHEAIKCLDLEATPIPCQTFSAVFEGVFQKEYDFGVIPVYNNTAGHVKGIEELVRKYPTVKKVDEFPFFVRHCLIANKGYEKLEDVYSHSQALLQCRRNIETLGLTPREFLDTAGAVRMIRDEKKLNAAAIASKSAAEEYGMVVIKEGLQDKEDNLTTFWVIARTSS